MKTRTIVIVFALVSSLCLSLTTTALAQPPPNFIQLGLALDGSGSISPSDWTTLKNGVANAVQNVLPQDGSVELTIVQFSTTVQVELAPTIVDAGSVASIVATINAMIQLADLTCIAGGINVTWETMAASANFDPAYMQVINLATDGLPNVEWFTDPYADCTLIRDIAVLEGLDELDAEGIGAGPDVVWLRDFVVWPQPGTIAPPYTPGWVEAVTTFEEFAEAISNKFERLAPVGGEILPINTVQLIAPYLLIVAIAVTAGLFYKRRLI